MRVVDEDDQRRARGQRPAETGDRLEEPPARLGVGQAGRGRQPEIAVAHFGQQPAEFRQPDVAERLAGAGVAPGHPRQGAAQRLDQGMIR